MRRVGVVLLALGLLAGGVWLGRGVTSSSRVSAVYLDPAPVEEWVGFSPDDRAGVLVLLQEALGLDPRITVLQERPPRIQGQPLRTWRLTAKRRGDQLHLMLRDDEGTLIDSEGRPTTVIHKVFGALGFGTSNLDQLLPGDSSAFWELASLSGPFTFQQLKPRQARALALAEQHPSCAAAWYRAAYVSLRLLIVEAASQADGRGERLSAVAIDGATMCDSLDMEDNAVPFKIIADADGCLDANHRNGAS